MPRSRSRVSQIAKTGSSGDYILRALWPSTYLVKVTAPGFQTVEQKGVVLAFDQATTLNFTLRPAGTFTMIQVTEAAPLLNRNFFGLVFLNAGVSEAAGPGTTHNYPAGTDTTVEQYASSRVVREKRAFLGQNSKLPPVPVRPTDGEYGMSVAPSSRPVP
jgi:hypothetical protein